MRVGREISIVSSDKIARGEALDIERYAIRGERCVEVANNWPTIGARSDDSTWNRVCSVFPWFKDGRRNTICDHMRMRVMSPITLHFNYYKSGWDWIFFFRFFCSSVNENWLRFKGICCYIVLIYIYNSI